MNYYEFINQSDRNRGKYIDHVEKQNDCNVIYTGYIVCAVDLNQRIGSEYHGADHAV